MSVSSCFWILPDYLIFLRNLLSSNCEELKKRSNKKERYDDGVDSEQVEDRLLREPEPFLALVVGLPSPERQAEVDPRTRRERVRHELEDKGDAVVGPAVEGGQPADVCVVHRHYTADPAPEGDEWVREDYAEPPERVRHRPEDEVAVEVEQRRPQPVAAVQRGEDGVGCPRAVNQVIPVAEGGLVSHLDHDRPSGDRQGVEQGH